MDDTARRVTASDDVAGAGLPDLDSPSGRRATRVVGAAVIRHRAGLEPISADDFAKHFGQLPGDDEG
jgi:hypothetical protein